MSRPLPLIIQTEHLAPIAAAWLRERATLVQVSTDDAQWSEALLNAEGLVVRTYTIVDEALLERMPRLRVVGRAGAGLDNIDVPACRRRGVEVVYAPDANTQAVVEYVLALMCDALRPRRALDRAIDAGEWNRLRAKLVGRREMGEMTLGILGVGRVGRRLAQIANSLFASVIYNDLLEVAPEDRAGAEPVSVEDLFSRADVLSVHVDGRASNRGFVNERLLSRMKSDALLINTSRGFVVNAAALAAFLRANPGAKAMLDVHDPEPFGPEYPLLHLPNATLFPHLASRSERAMVKMSWVVRDVMAVLEGREPEFPAPQSTADDHSAAEPQPNETADERN